MVYNNNRPLSAMNEEEKVLAIDRRHDNFTPDATDQTCSTHPTSS